MPIKVMHYPVCGYITRDEIDFQHCPVCKSSGELFTSDTTMEARGNWDTKSILMIMEMAKTGHYALERIVRAQKDKKKWDKTVKRMIKHSGNPEYLTKNYSNFFRCFFIFCRV